MNQKEPSDVGRIERRKEETRQKVINVATKLFRDFGFDATTMEQIAKEADIAKGTLYKYFPVKEAIVDEYIRRSFAKKNAERALQLREMPDTRSRLTQVLGELTEAARAQKLIFEKYLIYRMKSMVSVHLEASEKSGFYLVATEIIRLGQESGEIRKDLSDDILVELFEFALIEIVKQVFMESPEFNADEVIARCVDLCIHGARAQA